MNRRARVEKDEDRDVRAEGHAVVRTTVVAVAAAEALLKLGSLVN